MPYIDYLFRRPLVADTGFDQDLLSSGIDEHTVHVHPNAILLVGRTHLGPEIARDHSEHRSAVETKFGVRNDFNAIIA